MPKLDDLNEMGREEFVKALAPVFEHSPWVGARTCARRPFKSVAELHAALCATVKKATEEEKLALIRAHPDLVGRATLTPESRGEQAAAGLEKLSRGEAAQFKKYNAAYHERFGFPFVICARLNKKEAILSAFPARLKNSKADEIDVAIGEIFKIAELRLADLIS